MFVEQIVNEQAYSYQEIFSFKKIGYQRGLRGLPTCVASAASYRCYSCDRKARAANAQSFTPWQKSTIEVVTRRDHSINGCSRHVHIGDVGFPRGIESIEKILNLKIVFQDLEKVLNFPKMYIRY